MLAPYREWLTRNAARDQLDSMKTGEVSIPNVGFFY
jgi:hypothetical protein